MKIILLSLYGSILLCASSVSAYQCTFNGDINGTSVGWFERDVVMQVSNVNGREISAADLQGISAAAAQSWTDVPCSDMSLRIGEMVNDIRVGFDWVKGIGARENKNIIVFRNGNGQSVDEWLRSTSEYAITSVTWIKSNGRIVDTDIEINNVNTAYDHCDVSSEDIYTCESGTADLQSILTHEMGHVLGLDHPTDSSNRESTMWASAGLNEVKKRSLEQDDTDGICFLYAAEETLPGQCTVNAERVEPAVFTLTRSNGGCSQSQKIDIVISWLILLLSSSNRIRRRRGDT